jgi:hypothetical protein
MGRFNSHNKSLIGDIGDENLSRLLTFTSSRMRLKQKPPRFNLDLSGFRRIRKIPIFIKKTYLQEIHL